MRYPMSRNKSFAERLIYEITPKKTSTMWPVTCHVHVAELKETAQIPALPTRIMVSLARCLLNLTD